jgi:hypothetical protein
MQRTVQFRLAQITGVRFDNSPTIQRNKRPVCLTIKYPDGPTETVTTYIPAGRDELESALFQFKRPCRLVLDEVLKLNRNIAATGDCRQDITVRIQSSILEDKFPWLVRFGQGANGVFEFEPSTPLEMFQAVYNGLVELHAC